MHTKEVNYIIISCGYTARLTGNYTYENTKDDHAAHARNYAEIALQIGAGAYASEDCESPA